MKKPSWHWRSWKRSTRRLVLLGVAALFCLIYLIRKGYDRWYDLGGWSFGALLALRLENYFKHKEKNAERGGDEDSPEE